MDRHSLTGLPLAGPPNPRAQDPGEHPDDGSPSGQWGTGATLDVGPLDMVFLEAALAANLIMTSKFYIIQGGRAGGHPISKTSLEDYLENGEHDVSTSGSHRAVKPTLIWLYLVVLNFILLHRLHIPGRPSPSILSSILAAGAASQNFVIKSLLRSGV